MADVRLRDLNPAEFNFGVNVGGSLGVGTTSPNAKVEIRSDGSDAAGAEIRLQHANNNSTDIVSTVNFANNVGSVAMIQGGTTSGNTNGYISFHTDSAGTSAERMRILSDGKVGIGTNSPAQKLEVVSSANGGTIAAVIANKDVSAGTNQNVSLGFGLSRNSGAFKDRAGKIQVGRELDWTVDDANIDSFMAFYTYQNNAESEKMRILANGRVGIGTTSPANLLHVLGNSANGEIKAERSSGATSLLQAQASLVRFGATSNHNLQFFTNDTGRVTITNAGLVGIGTTSPTAALTVGDGTGSESIEINKSTSGSATLSFLNAGTNKVYIQADANEHLRIATNNAVHMSILENGNVGIGHTSPTAKLHVDGDLIVTGTVDVGSSGFNVSSGFILPFGGGTAPSGWLECNGAAVSRSTYSDLFAIIGTIYGAGDGSTTFNVPDLQGRVMMGEGGNTASRTPTDLENIGDTGGSQSVALVVDNLPSHSHKTFAPGSTVVGFGPFYRACENQGARRLMFDSGGRAGRNCNSRGLGWLGVNTTTNNTGTAGADTAHDNIQPSIVINYLIKT